MNPNRDDPRTPPAKELEGALAVFFGAKAGEPLVYGGMVVAVGLVVAGLAGPNPVLVLGAAIALVVAHYHWPLVARRKPALIFAPDRFVIGGFCALPWPAIRAAALDERAVRLIRLATLRLELDPETARQLAAATRITHLLRYRIWRIDPTGALVIRLNTLRASPETILTEVTRRLASANEAAPIVSLPPS